VQPIRRINKGKCNQSEESIGRNTINQKKCNRERCYAIRRINRQKCNREKCNAIRRSGAIWRSAMQSEESIGREKCNAIRRSGAIGRSAINQKNQ
jgi:hypothetical protein